MTYIIAAGLGITILLAAYMVYNPFNYPYFTYKFDVSGKRQPKIENYIDEYFMQDRNYYDIERHHKYITEWKQWAEYRAYHSLIRPWRQGNTNSHWTTSMRFNFVLPDSKQDTGR